MSLEDDPPVLGDATLEAVINVLGSIVLVAFEDDAIVLGDIAVEDVSDALGGIVLRGGVSARA